MNEWIKWNMILGDRKSVSKILITFVWLDWLDVLKYIKQRIARK